MSITIKLKHKQVAVNKENRNTLLKLKSCFSIENIKNRKIIPKNMNYQSHQNSAKNHATYAIYTHPSKTQNQTKFIKILNPLNKTFFP